LLEIIYRNCDSPVHAPELELTQPAKILAGLRRLIELRGKADELLLVYRVAVHKKP